MDMRTYRTIFAALGFAALSSLFALPAHAQLRIVTYNVANSGSGTGASPRTGMQDVLQAMGAESHNGIAKPVDVLLLQESNGQATTGQAYVNMLNSIYGAGTYATGTVNGTSTGAGTQSIIYRTGSVSLVSEVAVGSTTGANPLARQEIRYQIRPVGYGSDADVYVYNGHYKAGNASTDAATRNDESVAVRANADALGAGKNVMYVGDMNVYTSSESMYQTLLSSGNAQGFDPINRPGSWDNNANFKDIHTQSPATVSAYSGQTLGGMDSRFDIQLNSASMGDGHGTSYIGGSYHTFGNTGTHALNSALNTGSATAFASLLPGYTTAQAQGVLDKLTQVSDHLPVIADYRIPAKMSVTVAGTPVTVITGATVGVNVTVANSANVVAANGADTLDFTVAGSGALSGSSTGSDDALGGSVTKTLAFNTAVAGARTGTVNASSTSEAVANGTFSQNVSVNVLDHATPSFSSLTNVNALTIDFGTLVAGTGTATRNFSISNLLATNGFTAGLDLDSIITTGNSAVLKANLAAFANQLAGTSSAFTASLDTALTGNFSTTYTLNFSDQDLPGAASLGSLQLTLRGTVVPEAGTLSLLGMGVGMLGIVGVRLRRRTA